MTEKLITRRGSCVAFSRSEGFSEETAARLVAAGACKGGIADPALVSLAGEVLADESRRLKFDRPERPKIDCLMESIRRLPYCAHIWQMGRVEGANSQAFAITD